MRVLRFSSTTALGFLLPATILTGGCFLGLKARGFAWGALGRDLSTVRPSCSPHYEVALPF